MADSAPTPVVGSVPVNAAAATPAPASESISTWIKIAGAVAVVYLLRKMLDKSVSNNPPVAAAKVPNPDGLSSFDDFYDENRHNGELREQYSNYRIEQQQMGFRPVKFRRWMRGLWKRRGRGLGV